MRRICDEIWIIDLGGEGRGTRKSENVFAIQTPVVIAIAARFSKTSKESPAQVHFTQIDGTKEEKLNSLEAIQDFPSLPWEECPDGWHAPFRPAGIGKYFCWPLLTDLLPWQPTGVMAGRTWVIGSNAYSGDSGRPFRFIAATHSDAFRPPIPDHSGHPPGVERHWS
jgi:hypothetical protein